MILLAKLDSYFIIQKTEEVDVMVNFYFAWVWILAGFLVGSVLGLFFHKDDWLGGYMSWSRRMMRLGHIAFFGLAIINLLYFFSYESALQTKPSGLDSVLFVIGAVTMPLICFASAFKKPIRHLFFIPVLSLIAGVIIFITKVW